MYQNTCESTMCSSVLAAVVVLRCGEGGSVVQRRGAGGEGGVGAAASDVPEWSDNNYLCHVSASLSE